jgi:phospholipase/lecithinase/hemolysin
MLLPSLITLLAALAIVAADLVYKEAVLEHTLAAKGWGGKFKTHLTFGDRYICIPHLFLHFILPAPYNSYTDEGRLPYFESHNGSAPPVGWIGPDYSPTFSGGHSWVRYVSYYTSATLYNYAVSGAVCSNEITPRYYDAIHGLFPSVAEYEVPAFEADLEAGALDVDWASTVVTLWIGTNDLGGEGLLSHSQVKGKTIVDYTRCVFDALKSLYELGARRFVLLNIAPLGFLPFTPYSVQALTGLELAPLYAADSEPGPNRYWKGKGQNTTQIASMMAEEVAAANEIFHLRAATHKLRGAKLAVMDAHGLFRDIYNHPERYLNGTAPLDVKGYNSHCNVDSSKCWEYRMEDRDAFMWFDELHPGEQVGRVLAKEFREIVKGRGNWVTFYEGG